MTDTELAHLECGPRVAMHVLASDERTLQQVLSYLRWRYGAFAVAQMYLAFAMRQMLSPAG